MVVAAGRQDMILSSRTLVVGEAVEKLPISVEFIM